MTYNTSYSVGRASKSLVTVIVNSALVVIVAAVLFGMGTLGVGVMTVAFGLVR